MSGACNCPMTVLSTLLKADGMGLAERLSEWLLRRRERQEERNMRQVTAYFGSLLKRGVRMPAQSSSPSGTTGTARR